MSRKRWNRLEEAEDIIDQCFEVLAKLPLPDLRRQEQLWMPSKEMVEELSIALDRISRYMKRHKLNGWSHDEH